jgi:hypothetical protein
MAARFPLAIAATLTALVLQASATPAERPSPLFSSYEVVALELEAPFNDLFEHARTPASAEYAVTGKLSYTDGGREVTVDGVKVAVRGNTSRRETECAFPKLKVQLPAGAPASALLSGLTSLKIGTHCGESAGDSLTAKYGRLSNQQSPWREAFVYRLLESAGVPTLKARPAKVAYIYTDGRPGQSPPQEQPIVRNAMLLEDVDEAVKRFGGVREIGEKAFTHAKAQFSAADTVRIALAEAMIGNFDWCLKMTADDTYRCNARHPLWNIAAAATADGKARPLMHDFDVAGMVAGSHAWFKNVFNPAYVSSRSQIEVEVLAQVQRTRVLFSRAELDAARADFIKRKADAYRTLGEATIDAAGKRRAQEYVDAFYGAIGSDDAFYRPVVATEGARLYSNKDRAVVCSSRGVIPVGTPVSAPLQTEGTVIQVHVLDALWYWAEPPRCPEVRQGPVWIDADAVSRDFPK